MATGEASSKPGRDLSKGVKERIAYIIQQDIEECGKVAQYVRKRSKSREVIYVVLYAPIVKVCTMK